MSNRLLSIIGVWLACHVCVAAQSLETSSSLALHVFLGASVGAPIPVGNIPEGASGSARPGFVGGISIAVPVHSAWTLQIEPQYVHYKAAFNTPLTNQPYVDKVAVTTPDGSTTILEVQTTFTGTATGEFNTQYIQVPVVMAYSAGSVWTLLAGGYAGWMVATQSAATGVGTVGIRPEVVEKNLEFGEKMQGLDVGAQLGVQAQIFDDLRLGLRGVYGFTSVFNPDFQTVDRTVHNVFVHLTASVRLL